MACSTGEGRSHTAVHRQGGPGGGGETGGEKDHRIAHMVGQDFGLEEVAVAVILLETGRVKVAGAHPVGTHHIPEP